MSGNECAVKVRGLEIWPPVALAPMVGLSHSGLRSLVQDLGGVGLLYTEMLAAKRLPSDNPQISPMLIRTEGEKPLVYQLVTGDSKYIIPAIEKLHKIGADGVDLNLGCPAPIQKRQGAGASLALNRSKLQEMLRLIRSNTDLPVSVKIRLGLKLDDAELAETCKFYEDEGVDLITIHARLIGEKFCRKPRWNSIAAAKNSVSIPVFANGGIFSVADAKQCLEQSEADGIMVGRAAVEQPWLCSDIAASLFGVQVADEQINKKEVFYRYFDMLESRFNVDKRLGRLKLFSRYYAASFKFGHHLTSCILRSESMAEAKERCDQFFTKTAPAELTLHSGE